MVAQGQGLETKKRLLSLFGGQSTEDALSETWRISKHQPGKMNVLGYISFSIYRLGISKSMAHIGNRKE